MVCSECRAIAATNRVRYDSLQELGKEHPHYGDKKYILKHPKGCGCTCQHRKPKEWDSMFSVEQPRA